MSKDLKKISRYLFVLVAVAALISGCLPQEFTRTAVPAQVELEKNTDAGTPDVTFTLKTTTQNGKIVYMGSGGELDGQINPDLAVEPGQMVEIVLINGDGLNPDNLVIGDLSLASKVVSRQGQESRLLFKAPEEGAYAYYSTVTGHRYAGMEGRLVVGQPESASIPQTASDTAAVDQSISTYQGQPAVSFTLKTDFVDGKMAFIASGGELDGQVNPDLVVQTGTVVEIILENADGILHNIEIPDYEALSADVNEKGQTTTLQFTASEEGTFPYFCAIPGHRQAGMEGKLIVGQPAEQAEELASVSRPATDLPGPLNRSTPELVKVELETVEVAGRLADGSSYTFWTFNGLVPGPFIRVRVGDTVEVTLKNNLSSQVAHSVDFHATTGPGGGAVATQTLPGGETSFTFKALNPGIYVYHCATPMVAHHITNGMYGLILVEPEEGLPPVDREFYVMQGELYTTQSMGEQGELTFDQEKLLDEQPEYFVFNGSVGALTGEYPLEANVGETVRIFMGVGGPNFTSSFHVIGEIFDRVYDQGALTSPALTDVQTTLVPPGGAAVVEFSLEVPGRYILVDHALSRLERGLAGFLVVSGDPNPEVFDTDGPISTDGH